MIREDNEEDLYETETAVKDLAFEGHAIDLSIGNLQAVVNGVLSALSATKKHEINEWEQEIKPCEHITNLTQLESKKLESQSLAHCSQCELNENLWLCLVCGNLGCGRAQFGGVGGNSHGLAHFEATQHEVSIKLGSITPEGGDVFCYKCSDEIKDPQLSKHLAHWGINLAEQEKTEKSLTELQLEQNIKWDFSMTTNDGQELEPVFGPQLTGLKNLGNSCYLSSVIQCLFSLPAFQKAYYDPSNKDFKLVTNPSEDLHVQLRKIADGLLSGRYSTQAIDSSHQKGISPATFKSLIGKGHEEFSTMRQQDAFEFLVYLLDKISKNAKSHKQSDPTEVFEFQTDQRLECKCCHKVRYRTDNQENLSIPVPARPEMEVEVEGQTPETTYQTVQLEECFNNFTLSEDVEYQCKSCGKSEGAVKKVGFHSFPDVLVVNARRFQIINWVPTKLDIPVEVSDEVFSLDKYLNVRPPAGEEDIASEDEEEEDKSNAFVPNESALVALQGMGFPLVRCTKALFHTGNSPDAEVAMNWLFAHMEDPDIDEPFEAPSTSKPSGPSAEQISMLQDMGFNAAQARKALRECGGNAEAAVEWLFNNPTDPGEDETVEAAEPEQSRSRGNSELPANYKLKAIVCHKGRSIHAGHYVAFIRKPVGANDEDEWVLFNDEKVVRGGEINEMKKYAYVYIFERV